MRAIVITVSDRVSAGAADDRSGPRAAELLKSAGFSADVRVVADGVESVAAAIRAAVGAGARLVVTSGGTGFGPRDLTPEGTRLVIEREAPGLAEAMRSATFGRNPHGMLSRGVAGIVGSAVVINLPGSTTGVEESLEVVLPALPHALELLTGADAPHAVSE